MANLTGEGRGGGGGEGGGGDLGYHPTPLTLASTFVVPLRNLDEESHCNCIITGSAFFL